MFTNKVRNYLLKILALRSGDLRRTLYMQLYLFLIISVLLFLKPVSNSLFLSSFGVVNLPYVFIAIAIVAYFFTKSYQRFQKRFSFIKLHRIMIYVSTFLFVLFSIGMHYYGQNKALIIAFYMWVSMYALIVTSQFWIMANVIFNPREARRVFGIIGAGGIAGGIFGGYMTSLLVGFIGNSGLIFLSSILMVLCVPILNKLWNEHRLLKNQDSMVMKKRIKIRQKFSFRRLRKSRHLIILSAVTGLGVMVSKLIDFQFQGIATTYYTDPEALTSFFGFWFSTFNVIGLAIQLFVTSRVLKVLGVTKSQFILPSTFILTGLMIFFFPVLWAAIFLKGADGSFKQSIQRSVNELLIVPIPHGMKEQSKTFIDVFVDSVATGLSGIMLLILLHSANIATHYVSAAIVVLSILWLFLSFKMKAEYFISFKNQFLKKSSTAEKRIHPKFTFIQNINNLLNEENEEDLIEILDSLHVFPKNLEIDKTKLLLKHHNPEVRLRTLLLRPRYRANELTKLIDPLTKDPVLNIRVEAFLYLLELKDDFSEENINNILDDFDKNNDISLLCACCIYFRDNTIMKSHLHLKDRLMDWIHEGKISSDYLHYKDIQFHLLKSISYGQFIALYPYIDSMLSSEDQSKKIMAISTCAYTLSKKYADRLIQYLKQDEYVQYAESALLFYDELLIDMADKMMHSENYRTETKVRLNHIISKLGTQNAANYLSEQLSHPKFNLRKNVIYQLNNMKRLHPDLDYKTDLIFQRVRREVTDVKRLLSFHFTVKYKFGLTLEEQDVRFNICRTTTLKRIHLIIKKKIVSIFLLLGLEYDKSEILDVYNGLVSKDKLKKVYALEFLEMSIDYKYSKMLIPLMEVAYKKKMNEADLDHLDIKYSTIHRTLSGLYRYPDEKLKASIINMIETLDDPQYYSILREDIGLLSPMLRKRVIRKLTSIFSKSG